MIVFAIYLVALVVLALLILWAIRTFLPEVYSPARLVVGAIVLIILLLLVLQLVSGGPLPSLR